MGNWGLGLYQNDTALDVKDEFEELYDAGRTVQEITDKLMSDYKCIMGDIEEEPLFWFALSDTQWNLGVLMPSVKEKALFWIQKDIIAFRSQMMGLEEKLLSTQPPMRKVIKKRTYKCQWKIGDVFAYRLESNLAMESGLLGRYFLIEKVDETIWHPGHIVPIVRVKITNDSNLPSNIEEYNQLEYVQTDFTKYEERFWPIDMSRPKEDVCRKSKKKYQVDEYGFLPQYRVVLINTSKKMIPTNLTYLGNFINSVCPENEFVPHSNINIRYVAWKSFDETFETKMIKLYHGHNLRELSIYKDKATAGSVAEL